MVENPDITKHRQEKGYGQTSVGAPPMSVPHLDARVIDGKQVALSGPFTTFSTQLISGELGYAR